jgi:hypothetical protein
VVVIVFQSAFLVEIYQNDIFLFKKIIFNINILKWSKIIKILNKKIYFFKTLFIIQFQTTSCIFLLKIPRKIKVISIFQFLMQKTTAKLFVCMMVKKVRVKRGCFSNFRQGYLNHVGAFVLRKKERTPNRIGKHRNLW